MCAGREELRAEITPSSFPELGCGRIPCCDLRALLFKLLRRNIFLLNSEVLFRHADFNRSQYREVQRHVFADGLNHVPAQASQAESVTLRNATFYVVAM